MTSRSPSLMILIVCLIALIPDFSNYCYFGCAACLYGLFVILSGKGGKSPRNFAK